MKIISSEAGERLARAKRDLDSSKEEYPMKMTDLEIMRLLTRAAQIAREVSEMLEACYEAHCKATGQAEAVADELVVQGFGNAEGD